jgi:chromate transporter
VATFGILLAGSALAPLLGHNPAAFFAGIYRSGALVFGGGHVVLPLLREVAVAGGWMGDDAFLAGYGAAQALPGPLFAIGAYLGAGAAPGGLAVQAAWAAAGLFSLFLPGVLVALGAARSWSALTAWPRAAAALAGVNAAVVGVLAAALYRPVWTSAVGGIADAAIALAGFALLLTRRVPPLAVVAFCVAGAIALRAFGAN